MALATRCPHCHTTFRVAQDQLKLRAGLVRCGACKQIFNGVDHLLQAERHQPSVTLPPDLDKGAHVPAPQPAPEHRPIIKAPDAPAAVIPPAADAPHAEETIQSQEFADFSELSASPSQSAPNSSPAAKFAEPLRDEALEDPLQRITLIDLGEGDSAKEEYDISPIAPAETAPSSSAGEHATSNPEKEEAPLEPTVKATAPLQHEPVRAKTLNELRPSFRPVPPETAEEEEPDFVRKGRRRQRLAKMSRIAMSIGSLLLFIGLIAQTAYAFRDVLAASSPKMRTMLTKACQPLGCGIQLPAQIDSITLESSDFQSLPGHANTLVLTMLLRNQSRTVQTWPQIELTLNDANDKPIARRILPPQDYLPAGQDPNLGFPSHSEQAVKTYLQVSQLKPDGYRLYLFYL